MGGVEIRETVIERPLLRSVSKENTFLDVMAEEEDLPLVI